MTSQPGNQDARAAAESRRQKILASRGNRLAKLTNTGRGGEGSVFDHGPLVSASSSDLRPTFLGDNEPSLLAPVTYETADVAAASPSPSKYTVRSKPLSMDSFGNPSANFSNGPNPNVSQDSFMATMQSMASRHGSSRSSQQPEPVFPQPQSQVSRWLPFVHVSSVLCVVVYAIVVLEPSAWRESSGLWRSPSALIFWNRWKALLASKDNVPTVPLFYVFLALQLGLHGMRLLLERNLPPTPGLINSILPYLPSRFQLYIATSIKYTVIAEQFLDDVGLLVFILGAVVWMANP
ncbi:hypothetical protein DACRYDRAFT_24086 [Dacryopinax primogenitus]|uniref:Uncharacterized protein n=1 Tax=Dacryopinax primogenitus (strain DJM 731) TaxID=1858805 RepID=M5FZJ0_DACPD|nr:uncharacterized protein DACRYDRAFT_24086 [Dacryopinax primogenitus]EJT98981.1 hypothetical protein DACRYDRAFT_24086 [Dacryopinax primogenitus]